MSYLVANPEDRFSRDEAHLNVTFRCDLLEQVWANGVDLDETARSVLMMMLRRDQNCFTSS